MSVKYHTYTVADVRAWLYKGVQNGLSEQVISKVRANAIIHNPYVEDEMVIVVSATDGDKVVGYTAMFPDYLVRPNVKLTCPTTLYAHPEYADEFIGYHVTKLLHETCNGRMVIGSDMAKESALIDKLLGLKIEYVDRRRYILNRSIHVHTFRNLVSLLLEPYRKYKQNRNISKFLHDVSNGTRVEYSDFIDYQAYQFIIAHSENDMYLRSREMLNWRLRYLFTVYAPLYSREDRNNMFYCHTPYNSIRSLAKVYNNDLLIGLYCLAYEGQNMSVALLYTDKQNATLTYDILLTQVLSYKPQLFYSQYKELNQYLDSLNIDLKRYTDKFYYTHPIELLYEKNMQVQGMDGDMLA